MGNGRNSLGNSTEGRKSNIYKSQSLRFGISSRGETLEGVAKIGFCDLKFSDSDISYRGVAYFVSHEGLPTIIGYPTDPFVELKKGAPLVRNINGKIEIRYPEGNWSPFFVYLGCQIDQCIGRGNGLLYYPNPQNIIKWDKFLGLPEQRVERDLKKVGFDSDRLSGIMEVLAQYKKREEEKLKKDLKK